MNKTNGLSIAEFELLCVLNVIPSEGCHVDRLTDLLGLSSSLTAAVRRACSAIAEQGCIAFDDDTVRLTAEGVDRRGRGFPCG